MNKHAIHSILLLAGFLLTSCIEPYQPKVSEDFPDILVIDGTLDATAHKATVALTHSMKLDNIAGPEKETAAVVTIEEQSGNAITLSEVEPGRYEAGSLSIDHSKQYRLTVKTKTGKTYQSAYVQIQQTPLLDSISWKPNTEGVTIYANTHGTPQYNSNGYYQWNFTETWEYTSRYQSSLIFEKGEVFNRPLELDIYRCWKTARSTEIIVGSSKKLSADIIREFPLITVPKASYQLSRTYSILVQQRSLTEEGYNYWLQLQKTTENLGGLFDPLPGQITGNFTCLTNPDEPVLGFFGGSTVSEQRIFIKARNLPRELQLPAPYPFCSLDSIPLSDIGNQGDLYLVSSYGMMFIEGYLSTARSCVDCTTQGGVTKQPDFWE